jgi:hypothetical protein
VGDGKLEQLPDTLGVEKAQVGDQVNGQPEAHPVFGDKEKPGVQEGFAHQRKVHPPAEALFCDFIEKSHRQRFVHLPAAPGHQTVRTEQAVEIAAVGQFEKDAFERFGS